MNKVFEKDYYRMTGEKYSSKLSAWCNVHMKHNLKYVYLIRKLQGKYSIFTRVHVYVMGRKYGLEISYKARIGEGLYLGHPYNITVAEGVSLGKNVNLHKGCTIGRENRGLRTGAPTIGNNVYVGINSTIVGNIKIGDDVMVAPSTFINFDVPDHSVVIGNPASIHHKENATEGYINFRVEEL